MTVSMVVALLALVVSASALTGLWLMVKRLRAELVGYRQSLMGLDVRQDRQQRSNDELRDQLCQLQAEHDQTAADLDGLCGRFSVVEMHAGVCVPPKSAPSGFNINKRVEVVRMFHEGHSEEVISEHLAVPLGEVRLLLHIERNGQNSSSAATPRKGSRRVRVA